VNGELYGRVADPLQVPWAMVFPHDPSGLPRHPSQLYQAGGEGALLFLLLALLAWCTAQGARKAYLQVVAANAPALAVYDRFGFREAYRYAYVTL
jgi:phosphatidylglycerol:prolipoprotein diacylglycerol transferase